jgi:glycosyltransferase involved in cell wall biosynthesis
MRIAVYPHVLDIGGSQINAVDLAAAVRDLGHEVLVFGQPGPLAERIERLGLELVAAPPPRGRPAPRVMRALDALVRERGIELVHGYEWTTALEAYWGPRARLGTPCVATVMSMAVAPFIPRDLPLIVGTEQIAAHEREAGRALVDVLEPPVDLAHDAPGAVDGAAFARALELDPDALTVVVVTRLASELKLEGLLTAIDVAGALSPAVQLVVVGDGPSRDVVQARADRANARAGRRVAVLAGAVLDPRPAYAAADVCLGMGGSALRSMAFARPTIVQGEQGFWELLEPATEAQFLWTGWYGAGDGAEQGAARLAALLRRLADPAERERAGAHGRALVERRFSLVRAAGRQVALYEAAIADRPRWDGARLAAGAASARGLVAYRCRRRVARVLGRDRPDDFNVRPVATRRTAQKAPPRAAVGRA